MRCAPHECLLFRGLGSAPFLHGLRLAVATSAAEEGLQISIVYGDVAQMGEITGKVSPPHRPPAPVSGLRSSLELICKQRRTNHQHADHLTNPHVLRASSRSSGLKLSNQGRSFTGIMLIPTVALRHLRLDSLG